MFDKAVTRLTLWYLLILMLISLSFSIALYNLSNNELQTLQSRQTTLLRRPGFATNIPALNSFNTARITQIEQSRQHIELNLLYFNLIILIFGGGISYLLARRTLHPIQAALTAQNDFTTNASHELRTPLTAMKTEIEVALRDPDLKLSDSKELHRSTLEEIEKLEDLTSGLLRIARQDSTEKMQFQPCELSEVVAEAVNRVKNTAEKKKITISHDIQPQTIKGEFWSLVDVVTILLDNALKYSPAKTEVTITSSIAHHNHQVLLTVRDQGSGIPEADLPHIFERFYRADHSRSKQAISGYGLGLAIAKQIIELHHGRIDVTTIPDKGTSFTLVFPLNQPRRRR